MPRRPARPVSWVYSPGVRNARASPVNLVSRSMTTDRAGMLMPERQGLGGEHRLDQALGEAGLDRLLERRDHPGVVGGQARLQRRGPAVVAEDVEVVVGERRRCARSTISRMRARSSGVVSRRPASRQAAHGVVAAGPAEDEVDRRQHVRARPAGR